MNLNFDLTFRYILCAILKRIYTIFAKANTECLQQQPGIHRLFEVYKSETDYTLYVI